MQFKLGEGVDENEAIHIDPTVYKRLGKRKVNTSTFIPRASRELQGNTDFCSLMDEILENVLIWQSIEVCLGSFYLHCINFFKQLKSLLPEAHENLSNFVDCLPGNESPMAHPFSGFVLNINVSTRIHRDWNDKDICIVIPISDCEGGELVLMELGLVLDLKNGDMVIFRSGELSHFNLHYRGKRASLVLHSDRSGDSWVDNRNNWADNVHFHST